MYGRMRRVCFLAVVWNERPWQYGSSLFVFLILCKGADDSVQTKFLWKLLRRRARIRDQSPIIKALSQRKGVCRRDSQNPVSLYLQACQVKRRRRRLLVLPFFYGRDTSLVTARAANALRFRLVPEFFFLVICGERAVLDLHVCFQLPERLWLARTDLSLSLNQNLQRRSLHAACAQHREPFTAEVDGLGQRP